MLRKYIFLILAGFMLAACASAPFAEPDDQHIYLVRHAEKEPGRDPQLTPDGRARAAALATRLSKAKLSTIYSTNLRRTTQTAGPIALATEIPVIFYDPSQLDEFASQLRTQSGNILVVGHSNTTPILAAALGGEAGAPIIEATEYDRLYVLTIKDGNVTTEIERYGAPSEN
jgi:broad specificity phosphatase PhoE